MVNYAVHTASILLFVNGIAARSAINYYVSKTNFNNI